MNQKHIKKITLFSIKHGLTVKKYPDQDIIDLVLSNSVYTFYFNLSVTLVTIEANYNYREELYIPDNNITQFLEKEVRPYV